MSRPEHLDGCERHLQLAVAGVAGITQPFRLLAPVDVLLGLPGIDAPAGETEGLEAHGFQRDVAGEDHEIGPGDRVAILLLDRPEQAARLVEVAVIWPAVERRETHGAVARAAATVRRAVGAGAVPGHADEERAVMAVVGRPPLLRIRHQRVEIALQRGVIELAEGRGVIETFGHGARERRVLVQHPQVQLVRPPFPVAAHGLRGRAMGDRASAA
jgi:hypothetical protein